MGNPSGRRNSSRRSSSSDDNSNNALPMTQIQEPPRPHPNRLISPSPTSSNHNNSNDYSASIPPSSPAISSTSSQQQSTTTTTNNNNYPPKTLHLTAISSPSHLPSLPSELKSNNPTRPLLHIDEQGHPYHYFLNPMTQSVILILLVEMLERFCFYGINYTTTAYLTGEYNDDWNADMPSIQASSYVSISTAVAYTTPFVGAMLADNLLGEYITIIMGCCLCYIPGLILIALTTIPNFMGWMDFNVRAIQWGLLVLWPIGTGTVKACVNVFGAKQFHPILQSSLIERYYVNFYMCINIGALTGGVVVPIVAQWDVTWAYCIPVMVLVVGVSLFLFGGARYVKPVPRYDVGYWMREVGELFCCGQHDGGGGGESSERRSQRDKKQQLIQQQSNNSPADKVGIGTVLLLSSLIIPFNIAYAQMATTFIVQGSVMKPWGMIDAPMMNNADAISVLAFGYIIGNIIYPELNRRQIKIPTTHKFAIGSAFGAVAVGCAIITDYQIHRVYRERGEAISILWQSFPYFLIGIGEIFAVSAAYEVAFTVAPAKKKSLASAANLFMVGGAPNVFCIYLYNACRSWFLNANGLAHIHKLSDYSTAKVVNYFWLLEAIAMFGVIVNLLPPVKNWVASIEEAAAEAVKTPMNTPMIRKNLKQRRKDRGGTSSNNDEETPLIKAKKHADYLKYGSGPELRKFGSMRAGPSLKNAHHNPPHDVGQGQSTSLAREVKNKLEPYADKK
ncbi:proton-dependent oligopeptide transporter family protein [Skeletonema marinoi]|uniref:Proton-dependent oligopeptide transporter family protein n=1 Tax=Skeletonema marinoi TaxID=267567 RepID=A0AAD8XVU8_9STRA|nr:proton-dependent oligopeptide transporter family protein [Skeletonema marinoi]